MDYAEQPVAAEAAKGSSCRSLSAFAAPLNASVRRPGGMRQENGMMNRKISLATIATLVSLLSVSGYSLAQSRRIRKYVTVPAWRIQLLDSAGNPVKKAVVRQVWQDYDVEEDSHEEDLETDDHGYVRFPERSLKTSPKAKALGRARHRKELGVHASFGPDAYILAWADELEGFINYKVGEPLPTQLIMRLKRM